MPFPDPYEIKLKRDAERQRNRMELVKLTIDANPRQWWETTKRYVDRITKLVDRKG